MSKPAPTPQPAFDSSKMYIWVKSLESKVNNMMREVHVIKNDYIKKNATLKKDMKILNEDILEMKHQQESVGKKIDLIVKELKRTAGQEEVLTLKKYLELWNPLNFVTQRDIERILDTKLLDRKHAILTNKTKTNKKETPKSSSKNEVIEKNSQATEKKELKTKEDT